MINKKIILICGFVLLGFTGVFAGKILTPFVECEVLIEEPGTDYSLAIEQEKPYQVKNDTDKDMTVKIEVLMPDKSELKDRYKPIPDLSWIKVSKDTINIEPDKWGETDVVITIPKRGKNYGKKYQVVILSKTVGEGLVQSGLRSNVYIKIKPRRSLFKRIFSLIF